MMALNSVDYGLWSLRIGLDSKRNWYLGSPEIGRDFLLE